MNPSARPQTSRNRDRALARIRSITTTTAVAATVATAGFGTLAAFTYSGASTDATNATGNDTTVVAGIASDGTTTFTQPAVTSNRSTSSITGLQAAPTPVTTTHHTARVTSGGSH